MKKPLLKLTNIHAGYGELQILKGIDITLNQNEIVALIGPNGAGKSTVIKSIFNIANTTQGKILYKNKNITNTPTHELISLGISYVNQGRIVFTNLTVEENLIIGAKLIKDENRIKKNLNEIYKKFPPLNQKRNQLAYALSGGQQQMLALGRGLMSNPKLLMLDEPTLGLSPLLQKQLFTHIKKLKEDGLSILIVEQNAKQAIQIADATYLLENGSIALHGNKEILNHPKIKQIYLGGDIDE